MRPVAPSRAGNFHGAVAGEVGCVGGGCGRMDFVNLTTPLSKVHRFDAAIAEKESVS